MKENYLVVIHGGSEGIKTIGLFGTKGSALDAIGKYLNVPGYSSHYARLCKELREHGFYQGEDWSRDIEVRVTAYRVGEYLG